MDGGIIIDTIRSVCDAADYIHNHYGEEITIGDISSRVFLSPSYFSRIFRIITGYTVGNYLIRYRLYRGAVALARGTKPIIEISLTSGFSSQQAFTKSFTQAYGISPARFRMLKPEVSPFPPPNIWKEFETMELMDSFKNVKFMEKEAFYVVGIEADIHYNDPNGTCPIAGLWGMWNEENLMDRIPDKVGANTYGITHSETADSVAKYTVCTEVKSLNNLPIGLVGRRFAKSEYAVFETTLEIIWTGQFWKTFYTKWLPESGYTLNDVQYRENYATFSQFPAIEVYDENHTDEKSTVYIYAPIKKK